MCIEILNIVFDLTTSSFVKIVVFYNCYCDSIFRYWKFCDGSMDHSMGHGSMGQWVMGHKCDGSMGHGSQMRWVRWVMGQMVHGSQMLTMVHSELLTSNALRVVAFRNTFLKWFNTFIVCFEGTINQIATKI